MCIVKTKIHFRLSDISLLTWLSVKIFDKVTRKLNLQMLFS